MQHNVVPTVRREERNRELALHHANLIQQRKDIEAEILGLTETLLDLPSQQGEDAGQPYTHDVELVERSLLLFQPSDYDALIEERNIDRKCGYVLCPRRKRQQDTNAKFRIIHGKGNGAGDVEFVAKSDLEKWCSVSCEKYSSYLRRQLSSEPAWTRQRGAQRAVHLWQGMNPSGNKFQDGERLTKAMDRLDLGTNEHEMLEKMRSLAVERGDQDNSNIPLNKTEVKENDAIGDQVPTTPKHPLDPNLIEGYGPISRANKASQSPPAEPEDLLGSI